MKDRTPWVSLGSLLPSTETACSGPSQSEVGSLPRQRPKCSVGGDTTLPAVGLMARSRGDIQEKVACAVFDELFSKTGSVFHI